MRLCVCGCVFVCVSVCVRGPDCAFVCGDVSARLCARLCVCLPIGIDSMRGPMHCSRAFILITFKVHLTQLLKRISVLL